MPEKLKRVVRNATPEERARHAAARAAAAKEFPPLQPPRQPSSKNHVAAAIRKARLEQGLTWSEVAKKAGIASATTVRDLEYGRDARLSNVEAVAKALGLKLEVVAES